MRTLVILAAAALGLAACGKDAVREEEAPAAAADAAIADAAAVDAGTPGAEVKAEGAAPDERGTHGTAAPKGTGEPGTTLPTTAPAEADASANPAAPD